MQLFSGPGPAAALALETAGTLAAHLAEVK